MKTIRTTITNGVQTVFPVSFALGYIDKAHVYVYTGDVYTTQIGYTWVNSTTIETTSVLPAGTSLKVRRVVPKTELVNDYTNNAVLEEGNLDDSFRQALMWLEEIADGFVSEVDEWVMSLSLKLGGTLDANNFRIKNVGTPLAPTDAARIQDIPLIQGSVVISDTEPVAPTSGMRWYDPSVPTTYVYYLDGDSGQWVEEASQGIDGALRSDLAVMNSPVQISGVTAGHVALALKNTVTPEQFGAGANNIQLAINYCSSFGGGTVLLGPTTYTVVAPVEIKRRVNIIGVAIEATVIKKTVASSVDGIDAVIVAREAEIANNFRLENFKVLGNRTTRVTGNVVSTHGIFLNYAHFYTIKNVMAENCLEGFVLNQNYVGVLERITALMCQGYGFHSYNGCTTLTVSNALMWGTGGGYKVNATIYASFRDCACDHSDAGGRLDDPFLPQGSGGDYLNPNYVWDISASRISITTAGSENCYSKWLYGEGAFVDFINPYVFNMEGHGTPYRAIELRGTGKSRINISNAKFDIRLAVPQSVSRRMYFVESPRNQTIMMDTPVSGDVATFGEYAHPVKGVVFSETIPLIDYTQESMVVGQTLYPLIFTAANVEPTTTLVSNAKRFNVVNKTTDSQVIRLPIEYEGALEVIAQGSHTSGFDTFQLRVVGWDGVNTDVISTIGLSGVFDKREYVYLGEGVAATTKPLYLELRSPHSSDTTYFTHLKVSRIK